jgi:hypothetical protein
VPIAKGYCINTGSHGVLDSTTLKDIDDIFGELTKHPKVALYFHGGLVSRSAGMDGAARLLPGFLAAGNYPLFFVYESGFLEVVSRNLSEIAGEDVFKILLHRLLKYVVAKLRDPIGAKGITTVQPTDIELYTELIKRDAGEEPFIAEPIDPRVAAVSESEQRELRDELASDGDLMSTIAAIGETAHDETTTAVNTRGLTTRSRKSTRTLMSPEIVDEIRKDVDAAQAEGSRGVLSTAALLVRAGKILVRAIDRFRTHRDHGIYPTVVEEILREFYVANIGTAIWEAIKAETSETFIETPGQNRGGVCFLNNLSKILAATPKSSWPKVSLVGHSTGGVFINNLLAAVAQRKQSGKLPADFAFEHIVLLAPACTFWAFQITIDQHRDLFSSFRVFGMTDEAECKDALVPFVYTRSLLYFVSGLLEKGPQGKAYADVPLVGMQKFYAQPRVYCGADEIDVQKYVNEPGVLPVARRFVWSPCDDGNGLASHSEKHGDFHDDPSTLKSLWSIVS